MIAHIDENNRIQTIKEHCRNTANYAAENGKAIDLENVMRLAGLLHDFGKNTKLFERYITDSHNGDKAARRGDVNHSSAGARFLMSYQCEGNISSELTKELISYAVFSHHGLNDCLTFEGEDKFSARINPKKEIYYDEAMKNSKDLFMQGEFDELFEKSNDEILVALNKIIAVKNAMARDKKGIDEQYFLIGCLARIILSMLIDADRRDTAEFMSGRLYERMSDDEREKFFKRCLHLLENRLNGFECRNKIDELRKEMSEQCESFARSKPNGIYRLSIPTGGGKTYSSMRYALSLSLRLHKQHVIYIAPYLSILEQNAADIKKVFDDNEHILEHHSNVLFSDDDNPEELEKYEMLSDDWSSPIILTTMVRFLDVLFGGSNSDIRRMHQLKNSVIIIDEAQSIPVKYINMFNTMINFLSNVCNTTVVMCTATQPLFERVQRPLLYSENRDIISDIEKYSSEFKRADILTDYAFENADTQRLSEIITEIMEKNCLVILNTKSAVQKLYDSLTQTLSPEYEIVQLTTYMCAQHRLDVIEELKQKLSDKQRLICVSTQLIEAGVDISFEAVVRSLSGLDSIAQAAGRCNRNGENEVNGRTYIVQYSEENVSPLEDIKKARESMQTILYKRYDDLLMPAAMEMFYKQYFFDRADEMDCSLKLGTHITMYSLLARNSSAVKEYKKICNKKYAYYLSQSFKTAAACFKPIDDNNSVGIIVYYGKSKELIQRLYETSDFDEQRKILRQLQRYTVNIGKGSAMFRKISEINAFENSLFDGSLLILSESYYNETGISPELSMLMF